MKTCDRIQSVFPRLVEGEAAPEEALEVARHIGDCTCCKILWAREGRLAEALGRLKDPLPVDARFLEKVMEALPEGPPPSAAGLVRRRLIRIAGFGALAGAAGSSLRALEALGFLGAESPRLHLGFETAASLFESLGAGARSLLIALVSGEGRLASGCLPDLGAPGALPALLATATVAFVAVAGASWVAAWSVSRREPSRAVSRAS